MFSAHLEVLEIKNLPVLGALCKFFKCNATTFMHTRLMLSARLLKNTSQCARVTLSRICTVCGYRLYGMKYIDKYNNAKEVVHKHNKS